jgi:dTDP-4-amino-4,6-dideoxygalactose transaminase
MAHDGHARIAAPAPNVYDAEPIPEAARAEIDRLLASGDLFRYTADKAPVACLEEEFAAFMGTRYALAVSSCSAAMFLALKALDLPRGSKVLIPAFTFAAVPSAVIHADCVPVLVEVGHDFRIDMTDFRIRLAEGAGAVMISHMRGHTSDMDQIMAACDAAGVPVIEDAAHSLGTLWGGKRIGTIGKVGCFSFQSYKLINAGEGGMLVTDDPEIAARAVIMSGAYEHNWKKHPGLQNSYLHWQNKLPLYNLRMQNLSAAVIRPQIPEVDRRVRDGRANHDRVADRLNASPWFRVPKSLPKEDRAPDSLQFNLIGVETDEAAIKFQDIAKSRGVGASVFGLSKDNARAFWNWEFLGEIPELPMTRAMLMRAGDLRLPARLTHAELDYIADTLIAAADEAFGRA